jgi:micrococcal nuclease
MKERYKGKVARVIDGDTVVVSLDVQFLYLNMTIHDITFRLVGINTPEIKGEEKEEGLKVKEYVKELIEGEEIEVIVHGFDKYGGRWDATVYHKGKNINAHLLRKGMGEKLDEKGSAVE